MAVPIPAPTHNVISPVERSLLSNSSKSVPISIAPVAPNGCPIAIAPPFTLTLSLLIPIASIYLSTTAAKASLTSNYDSKGRNLIYDFLPKKIPRVISIGRLDYNTEGLILLTNDGELARKLEMPSSGFIRKYRVRVYGKIEKKKLEQLANGIIINKIKYKPINVVFERQNSSNAWIHMSLKEGKNREIRNIIKFFGWEVTRLIRLEFGPFKLGSMKEKDLREIKYSDFSKLL